MARIKVYYPNLIKHACKKRYNSMLRPFPLMGRGGAAIVVLINYIVAYQFGYMITRWLSDNVMAWRQAIRGREGGREGGEGGEEIGGGLATARRL